MKEDIATVPCRGQFKLSSVATCIVVGLADIWWVGLECCAPSISHILIYLIPISVYLEESGNGEFLPLVVIEVSAEEVLRRILVVFHKVEFPCSLHRQIATRLTLVALFGKVDALIGKEVSPSLLSVLLI